MYLVKSVLKSFVIAAFSHILHIFAKKEHRMLFETVSLNGTIHAENPEARLINPGRLC